MRTSTLLYQTTRRTVLFLTLFQFALLLFFIFGNYQKFLDSNQILIIRVSAFCATALITFCVLGIIQSVLHLISSKSKRNKKFSITIIVFHGIACLYGIVTLILSRAIDILSQGINI